MSRDNLDAQLQRVGQAADLPGLRLDEDGACHVRIDGTLDLAIEFDDSTQSVILTARCGPLPVQGREAVLAALLDANFYGAGSGGATLSTNSREGAVYLQYREATAQLDATRLEDLLRGVILNAEFWGARLQKIADGAPMPSSAAPDPMFMRA